jgi:hypothetical protein
MFKKNKENSMKVEEHQYRAVITKVKNGWSASVQMRVGIDEWKKVRCGLKGVVFVSKEFAEAKARLKIQEQINLDKDIKDSALLQISHLLFLNTLSNSLVSYLHRLFHLH